MTMKVLLAEDEEDVLNVAKASLQMGGRFELLTVADGQEAFDTCVAEKPDLVLLDLLMPKKSGITVCRELRATPQTKDMKIVILSGLSQESDKQSALSAGADDFITKPFSPSELLGKVGQLLGLDQQRGNSTMPDSKTETEEHRSFAEMTKEQIAIYARELSESFRKERGLRVSLQERDSMLDQRAREVTALNHLLQQQILEWHNVADEYREILLSIRDLLDDGQLGPKESDALGGLIEAGVSGANAHESVRS